MAENEPERKRRKIVIDWKEEQKQPSSRRSTRSPRRSFDRSTRNIILVAVLLLAILLGAGFMGINSARDGSTQDTTRWGTGERRNSNLRPRSIDIWAIHPDGSLQFVTLDFDVKPADEQAASLQAQIAGPLIFTTEDVTKRAVIGSSLDGFEGNPGPGDDSNLVYELFTLTRDSYTTPYGVDVICQSSPYINVNPTTGGSTLSLGTKLQNRFQQVIVAVALPRSAAITQVGDPTSATSLQPYRDIKIGDWRVLYFDTTQATGVEAIHVYYSMIQSSDRPNLDYMKIDRRR